MRSIEAVTSRRGNSRNCSVPSCAQRSDRCANRSEPAASYAHRTARTLDTLEKLMSRTFKAIAIIVVGTLLAVSASAQSAKEIRRASPYNAIDSESAPKLIVDPPLRDRLALGVLQVQYRAENVHIVPVFGAG